MKTSPPLWLPCRDTAAHKGSFGRALLIGGSRGMAGSIALSSIAALHTGSGLVSTAVPDAIADTVASFHPAIITLPCPDSAGRFAASVVEGLSEAMDKCDAIGCGPGMTTEIGTVNLVKRLLSDKSTAVVFDADALNAMAAGDLLASCHVDGQPSRWVLTPHPGELQRLTGVSAKDSPGQIDAAKKLSQRYGLTIVIKGGPSHVVSPGEGLWTGTTGNPGMSTAGTGDVLTGVITSLLGQGLSASEAARLGVWLHGRTGDVATEQVSVAGMTAKHLVECLAGVAGEVVQNASPSSDR